jgi:hypothetical protein
MAKISLIGHFSHVILPLRWKHSTDVECRPPERGQHCSNLPWASQDFDKILADTVVMHAADMGQVSADEDVLSG